jgi:hypothetical protein
LSREQNIASPLNAASGISRTVTVNTGDERKELENPTFIEVVDYFLGHSKPEDEPKPRSR